MPLGWSVSTLSSQETGGRGTSLTWPPADLLPDVALPEGLITEEHVWSARGPKTC